MALALVRPVWSADPLRFFCRLNSGRSYKYWWHILGQDVPLVLYELVEVCCLQNPDQVHAQGTPNYGRNPGQPRSLRRLR